MNRAWSLALGVWLLAVVASVNADRPRFGYDYHVQAVNGGDVEFFWKKPSVSINGTFEFALQLKGDVAGRWVALGIGTSMHDADMAAAWLRLGVGFVRDYWSEEHDLPKTDAHQDVIMKAVEKLGGYTLFRMKRKLATGDSEDRDIELHGHMDILFAHGYLAEDGQEIGGHHHHDTDHFVISLESGEVSRRGMSDILIAHSVLMGVSWGLLSLVAVFIERFLAYNSIILIEGLPGQVRAGFFGKIHAGIMIIVVIATFVAFGLGLGGVSMNHTKHFSSTVTVNRAHSILGLITVILLGTLTVSGPLAVHNVAAGCRSKQSADAPTLKKWRWIHGAVGYLTQLCAAASIVLGVAASGKFAWLIYILIVYFLLVIGVFGGFVIRLPAFVRSIVTGQPASYSKFTDEAELVESNSELSNSQDDDEQDRTKSRRRGGEDDSSS